MKICVIGGGFYGCFTSLYLANLGHNISIFEKNNDIMKEAISNNQHRLHLGFHYPRCDFTIEQSKKTHDLFISTFPDCVEEVEENLYAIHKNSFVNLNSYLDKLDQHDVGYEIVEKYQYKHFFKNINEIQGILKTKEKKINLLKLKDKIKKQLLKNNNITIFTNHEVTINDEKQKDYDYVINCSYTNPQIFLDKQDISVKHELCFMPLIEILEEEYLDKCITIMDGPYSSLYQTEHKNIFTVSSVIYTPYFKSFNSKSLYKIKKTLTKKEISDISEEIIQDCKKYIKIPKYKIKDCYISQKCKILDDKNAYRGSFLLQKNNTITIMSGKISAIFDLLTQIEVILNG